jgi:hypothetical protein
MLVCFSRAGDRKGNGRMGGAIERLMRNGSTAQDTNMNVGWRTGIELDTCGWVGVLAGWSCH